MELGSAARNRQGRVTAAVTGWILHAAVYNAFNVQRHLISRPILRRFRAAAFDAWETAAAAT